jgi:hypothetical protein
MRKHKTWMLTAVLLAAAILPNWAQAASITVDGSTCTLDNAITSANNNADTGGCVGSGTYGDDTITLQADVTLSAALPQIASTITLEGGGHFISGNNDETVGSVLYITSDGDLTLNQTIIKGGTGFDLYEEGDLYGGGILNVGTVNLTNSTVSGNTASSSSYYSYSSGGGIYNAGTVNLTNSTVSGNTADSDGGGIENLGGTVNLTNSTVSGNTASSYYFASFGGGIENLGGTVNLTNSTVSGNTAYSYYSYYSYGGGIFNDGTVTLTNSTVSGNTAFYGSGQGGGIENWDTVTLHSSIISGNTADSGNEVYNNSTVNAASFNVFGHSGETDTEAFSGFTPGSSDVTATSDGGGTPTALNAILNTTLADNGGLTQTHALVEGSPAVDLDKDCSTKLTIDQRSYGVRPVNAGCDAGAYEYGAVPVFTVTPSAGTGGSVSPTIQIVAAGYMTSFTVTPNEGYTTDEVVGGTCPKGSWDGSTYTTGQIAENCTVVFSFDKKINMAPIYKLLLK